MKKVIFWDFDGTLALPNDRFEQGFCLALQRYGYQVDYENACAFLKSVYPWEHADCSYETQTTLWWERFFDALTPFYERLGVKKEDYAPINQAYKERICTHNDYALYDDTMATLKRALALGYRNYLLSNNYPELADIVKALGIYEYFDGFVISGCVGYEKPRRELFEYAKAQAGCTQAVMVGDNPIADIIGAKNAGFRTVFVHKSCENQADFACATLTEALEHINNELLVTQA